MVGRKHRPRTGNLELAVTPIRRAVAAIAHIHVREQRAKTRADRDRIPLPRSANRRTIKTRVAADAVVLQRGEDDPTRRRANRADRPIHRQRPELAVQLHDHARLHGQRRRRRNRDIPIQHVRATGRRPGRIHAVSRRRHMRHRERGLRQPQAAGGHDHKRHQPVDANAKTAATEHLTTPHASALPAPHTEPKTVDARAGSTL